MNLRVAGESLAMRLSMPALIATLVMMPPLTTMACVAQTSAPVISEDPATTVLAKKALSQWQSGTIDRAMYDDRAKAAFTPDAISTVSYLIGPLGAPERFAFIDTSLQQGYVTSRYRVEWKSATIVESISLGADQKIAGLYFRPNPVLPSGATTASPAVQSSATPK